MNVRTSIALGLASLALVAAAGAQDRFRPEEERALLEGQLVRRVTSRREGRSELHGGMSWQLVRAPIEDVWEAAIAPSNLPRLIPSLVEAQLVEQRGNVRLLRMRHDYGIASTTYYARMVLEPEARSLSFELDRSRPHDMRAGRGFLALSAHRRGTIVTWGMLADPGGGLVMQLFAPMLTEWLLLPPRCMRILIEEPARSSCT